MTTATTEPQYMNALAKANRVKAGHADLKRAVKVGAMEVAEAINDPRSGGRFTIGQLLRAQHGWGPRRVRRQLFALAIPENQRVEALTERQRAIVATALRRGEAG